MKRLSGLALFLFVAPLAAQQNVAVQNATFSAPVTLSSVYSGGNYENGSVPSWTLTGAGGIWAPGASEFPSVPGGGQVLFLNGGTASQDLGPLSQGTYTLTVPQGARGDGIGATASCTAALYSGTTLLASQTQANTSVTKGGWQTVTVSYTTPATLPAGDLVVSLSSSGSQCDLTNVSVTFQPPGPPPTIDTMTLLVQLYNCTTCTLATWGTSDWTPLASASIYQGATLVLAQVTQNSNGSTVTSNICSATLNANAQASCSGGLNVAPSFIELTYTITNPAGAILTTGVTFSAPSLSFTSAVSGNVNVWLGFDSKTMAPRFGAVGSS